jgi:hypothetical protein
MKYFLGFLAAVGMVVLVVVLIFRGFSGSGKPTTKQTVLSDYANTSTLVRLTIDGPVTADQEHDVVRITIGRDGNTLEVLNGYQGALVKSQSYNSNTEAYGNFLRSLQFLGYTKGDPLPANADERGHCPAQNRYIYEIISDSAKVQRYWSDQCGGGTFKGKPTNVRSLFRAQIPDYGKLTSGLSTN